MGRYIEATEDLVAVFLDVVDARFPVLGNLKTKLLLDTKRRLNKDRLVFASIETASEKIKFFSKDDIAVEGYDLIVIVDAKAWDLSTPTDKKRIMSHELRHVLIDEKGKIKIIGHEIEDFYAELELNKDDPQWSRKLAVLVNDVYEQEKEDEKTKKKGVVK